MRRVVLAFSVLLFTLVFYGCSGTRTSDLTHDNPTEQLNPKEIPTGSFEEVLLAHLALPEAEKEEIRQKAEAELKNWRRFETEARQYKDAGLRHWFYPDFYLISDNWGVGLGNSITALKEATAMDPSYAEGWLALGRLCAVAGDMPTAKGYLDKARRVALARQTDKYPVDHDQWLEIYRQRAWALRDLALWEEGLAAVHEGLTFHRGDPDLVLIKGLLLAGAGRREEAMSLAIRMKPFSYPKHDIFHYGIREQTSDYANRWIKSQALMADGDYELARHVLGELNSYPYRRFLPHQQRFWNDVGLVAELSGDEQAGNYYAIGFISSGYWGYFPWMANNLEPLVLDSPAPEIPIFTSYGGRFHIGGSPLAFAAHQMNMMNFAIHAKQRDFAAGRAKLALDIAEKRNIRPDIVRAMRGRIYFAHDELELARKDLEAAHEEFTENRQVDSGTSLLLGMMNMTEGGHEQAIPFLLEAVEKDPQLAVGWRSLGVSLVHLGRPTEAAYAMDQALLLEPNSVSGLYNRGLLHLQNRQFDLATADLDRAFKLDPENHEVQRLLQMAAANFRAEGGQPQDLKVLTGEANVTPDEIYARLEADIQGFFAVPDSVRSVIGPGDQIMVSLEKQYFHSGDHTLRKILALAYMDRGMYESTQALLSPGWGVDLTPEEEVMLLYVDRSLGETKRAEQLAEMLLKVNPSDANPYLLLILPEEERKHWTETILAKNHFYEGYSAANMQGNPDATRYARWMRIGFTRLRMASNQQDVGEPIFETPFFRFIEDSGGVESAVSGGSPVSGRVKGGVKK